MEHQDNAANDGIFYLITLPYAESSHSAHAAFIFPVLNTNYTVRDWCDIIRGRFQQRPGLSPLLVDQTSDLTAFRFVRASRTRKVDGCRDFM